MNNIRSFYPLGLLLIIPIINLFYMFLNNDARGVSYLVTDFDRMLPMVNIFVIPYLGWYGFIIFTLCYFLWKDRKLYYTTLWSMILGMLISYVVYFFFQTSVPRPEVLGEDWLSQLVLLVYNTDQPYNCFPSIHCLTSYLMMRALASSSFKNKWNMMIIFSFGSIVLLSTLLIKQHVVMDVFASIILVHIVFSLVSYVQVLGITWRRKKHFGLEMNKKLEV